MVQSEIYRIIRTNVSDAYGYVTKHPTKVRWVFRYDPGASGEFHIYEYGYTNTVKQAVDKIYACAREYDFRIVSTR